MTDKAENPNAKLGVTDAHGNFDDYFGVCPECGRHDGYINIGRGHWFYCSKHRVKWCVGSNLFSAWRHQTEDEQWRIYEALGFDDYQEIEAAHPSLERIEEMRAKLEELATELLQHCGLHDRIKPRCEHNGNAYPTDGHHEFVLTFGVPEQNVTVKLAPLTVISDLHS